MSDRFEVPIAGGFDVPLLRMARVRQNFDPSRRLSRHGASVSKLPARRGRMESEAMRDFDLKTMATESSHARRAQAGKRQKGA